MKSGKCVYPFPVYVAEFAAGETTRMSLWTPLGKPLDFQRGRKIACAVIGNERGRVPGGSYDAVFQPAADIVSGHIEWEGKEFPDPHFGAVEAEVPAKRDPILRLVSSIKKLDWAALEAIQAAIDERLAA